MCTTKGAVVMKCELVEKTSKSGNKYIALEVSLTPTYKKTIFLEKAEIELIKANVKAQ